MRDILEDIVDFFPIGFVIGGIVAIVCLVIVGISAVKKVDNTEYDHAIINMNGIERVVEITDWSCGAGGYTLTTINGDHFRVSYDNAILTDARE